MCVWKKDSTPGGRGGVGVACADGASGLASPASRATGGGGGGTTMSGLFSAWESMVSDVGTPVAAAIRLVSATSQPLFLRVLELDLDDEDEDLRRRRDLDRCEQELEHPEDFDLLLAFLFRSSSAAAAARSDSRLFFASSASLASLALRSISSRWRHSSMSSAVTSSPLSSSSASSSLHFGLPPSF